MLAKFEEMLEKMNELPEEEQMQLAMFLNGFMAGLSNVMESNLKGA